MFFILLKKLSYGDLINLVFNILDEREYNHPKTLAQLYDPDKMPSELKVPINANTVWLRQNQISEIFQKDRSVITKHINNIFKDNEVDEKSNVQKMHIANSDKPVNFYSLDIVLAVGYRTNSSKAIKFRQWATSILKNYIINGYSINGEKITNERFISLENDVNFLKEKVNLISTHIEDKSIKPKQGIFYDGQVYDAYIFINDLIKSAKSSITIIDNYCDESVLTLLSKRDKDVPCTIYTKNITKQLKLDLEKYNEQYPKIDIVKFENSHDRFLILDDKEVYHIGASLKDLGKKWFGFSKFDIKAFDLLLRLKDIKNG
ncbi:MAG: RhuM family protein [Campylobacterota bacterium]